MLGDHEGSPTNCTERGGQRTEYMPGVEVTEVGMGKSVAAITPNLIYKIKGGKQEVYDVPLRDHKVRRCLRVPRGYPREGTREELFMYSRWLSNACRLTRATSTPCTTAYSAASAALQRPY